MDCPFCRHPLRPGTLRSRGYASVWTPEDAGASRIPPPYDVLTRRRRGEAVVVGYLGARGAYRCDSCGAVVIAPHAPHAPPAPPEE